jgi:hypothetical protein
VGKGSERDARAEALQNSIDDCQRRSLSLSLSLSFPSAATDALNIENANDVVVDGSEAVREFHTERERGEEGRERRRVLFSLLSPFLLSLHSFFTPTPHPHPVLSTRQHRSHSGSTLAVACSLSTARITPSSMIGNGHNLARGQSGDALHLYHLNSQKGEALAIVASARPSTDLAMRRAAQQARQTLANPQPSSTTRPG